MAFCKLCGLDRPLVKAHIIPEAFFREMDPGGQIKVISDRPGFFPKRSPVGEYDETILCQECEDRFQVWDDYGSKLLIHSIDLFKPIYDQSEVHLYQCSEFNAQLLRFFVLSVLWRASVSSRTFYNSIQLGPYEKKLKNMVLMKDEIIAQSFPIVFGRWVVTDKTRNLEHFFMNPIRLRVDGANTYKIYLGRFVVFIKVSSKNYSADINNFLLHSQTPLLVFPFELDGSKDLDAMKKAFSRRNN